MKTTTEEDDKKGDETKIEEFDEEKENGETKKDVKKGKEVCHAELRVDLQKTTLNPVLGENLELRVDLQKTTLNPVLGENLELRVELQKTTLNLSLSVCMAITAVEQRSGVVTVGCACTGGTSSLRCRWPWQQPFITALMLGL